MRLSNHHVDVIRLSCLPCCEQITLVRSVHAYMCDRDQVHTRRGTHHDEPGQVQ